MFHLRYLPLSMFLVFSACVPVMRPGLALDRVNAEFHEHDSGEFFADYGSPAATTSLKNGGKSYRWVSVEPVQAPAEGGYISYPGGHYAIPDETNGELITGYCSVNIRTDANDRIQAITLLADSIGKFSGTRCSEIFGQGWN